MAYLARHSTLPQPLSHEPVLEVAEASTLLEVVPWQEHVPETELLGARFQVVDYGRMAFPSLVAFAELGVEDGVGGYAFFFNEFLYLEKQQSQVLVLMMGLRGGVY